MPAAVNGMKECTKCGETKSVSEYYKRKDVSDGFRKDCKKCISARHRAKYVPHPIVQPAVNGLKECIKCGKTKAASEYFRGKVASNVSTNKCKSCRRIDQHDYHMKNREKRLAYGKQYRRDNKETLQEKDRIRNLHRREARLTWWKNYYENNSDSIIEQHRQYREDQPAGVYKIENTITGKTYVGQSTVLPIRFNQHQNELSRGIHYNSILQADYNKYGKDVFNYRVIQEYPCDTSPDVLFEHEQRVIDEYISEGKEVYNVNRGC